MLEHYQSSYKLQIGTRQGVLNISRLKPSFTPPNACPAQPPKQGRPRKQPPALSTPCQARQRASFFNCQVRRNRASSFSRTSSISAPGRHTRSGWSLALLPLVSDWRGGPVEDNIRSPLVVFTSTIQILSNYRSL